MTGTQSRRDANIYCKRGWGEGVWDMIGVGVG